MEKTLVFNRRNFNDYFSGKKDTSSFETFDLFVETVMAKYHVL